MGLKGKVIVELEAHHSAEEYYDIFKNRAHHISNISDRIPHVHMHEGSWGDHGSVRHWDYVAAGKVEKFREKTRFDDRTKTMTMEAVEGDPLKLYKSYVVIMTVVPKDKGSLVKWTLDYEKLKDDVPEPLHYLEIPIKITKDLDATVAKA